MSNIFISVWLCCVKIVFTFLHIVYSGLQYFDLTWTFFKRKWESLLIPKGVNTEDYVSQFVTGLSTYPTHLAVIVGKDEIACQDFTNLVIWCLAAGISFLTVYDQKGLIKKQEEKLSKYFFEQTSYNPLQIRFSNMPIKNINGSNGFKNKLYISILSYADGNSIFMDVVRQTACRTNKDVEQIMSQDIISEEFFQRSHLPDPELAIVVAPELCTYGYPPWNIRLTEFIRVSTIDEMNATEFCHILARYAKCEKRVGK